MSEKAPDMLVDQLVDEYVEKKADKMKRCEVPYDRLTIEANVEPKEDGDVVENLLKDSGEFSAWNPGRLGERNPDTAMVITIKLKDGFPDLILTDYDIKTAIWSGSDPVAWFLTPGPRKPNSETVRIHDVPDFSFLPNGRNFDS